MTRREWLQIIATAAATTPLLVAADDTRPLFFTADEFALLDALSELIIPADAHSPGAHAAEVAKFIDFATAKSLPGEAKDSWTSGLKNIDSLAKQNHDKNFLALSKAQQIELLNQLDKQNDPFFGQLKMSTAFAYYSSSIGIHQEMGYLGNVLLEQFAGYSV